MTSAAPTTEQFRRVMGRFATGVTVVTTRLGQELHGMTANAVASVSLEPMLVLVCVDRSADTHAILSRAGVFALNILERGQEAVAERFARKDGETAHHLEGVGYRTAENGCPVIEGSLAHVVCETVSEVPAGDHTIFIGRVVDAAEGDDGTPLVFFRGRYGTFTE